MGRPLDLKNRIRRIPGKGFVVRAALVRQRMTGFLPGPASLRGAEGECVGGKRYVSPFIAGTRTGFWSSNQLNRYVSPVFIVSLHFHAMLNFTPRR